MNIDNAEINKFDSLEQEWWDPHGKLRTLHTINPVRLEYIQTAIGLTGKSVLDLGCGGGLLSEAMAACGAIVTGLDASQTAIDVAVQHQQGRNFDINYIVATAEDYAPQVPASFDAITCMELLEHIPDPEALLRCCGAMLKPGGHIFLATLNRNLKSYLAAILAGEYLLKLLPKGTHDYARFIRPSELSGWLRQTGFTVRDITGMIYLPGVERAILTGKPDVNYLLHAQLET